MKFLLRLVLFCLLGWGNVYAQSDLPPCPSSGYFHNCFGTFTYSSGMKYVGEWRDDKYNGQGALFYANGSSRQGIWADGVIIRSATVQLPLVANQVTNVSQAQTSFGNLPVCKVMMFLNGVIVLELKLIQVVLNTLVNSRVESATVKVLSSLPMVINMLVSGGKISTTG